MYFLSRSLFAFAVVTAAYGGLIIAVVGYPSGTILMAGIVLVMVVRRQTRRWTTLGSARWAEEEDLRRAGMLSARTGLILGRIFVPTDRPKVIRSLLSTRVSAYEACERCWHFFRRYREYVVRAPQVIHAAVFAPSGQGKAVSCILPFLMTCSDSCVVIDFKGELALATAEYRRRVFGHRTILLDLFGVVTKTSDTFNILDTIDPNDPLAIDACNDIAKALVVRSAEEKEPHWSDSAEAWISAILAMIVHYGGTQGTRSLQTMREVLSSPERIAMAIKVMKESTAWNGMLARMGSQLELFVDRERSSVLSTVLRHLRFLDTPTVEANTRTSSFDPAELDTGKMTIYLILPPEHMRASAGLLRTWISSCLRAVIKRGLDPKHLVHFILDEAASLGHLEAIEDALDKYRGYGCRLQFYYQSPGQLKKCFPNGQDQTLLSNTTQIYFGVNDTATADLVSARLGEQTVIVESGGSSYGSSSTHSSGGHAQDSRGYSHNSNSNWQQQARKLLKPEEVIALHPRIAITFTPGVPPICTELVRHYEESDWGASRPWVSRALKAVVMLCVSLMCFGVALAMAIAMTKAISRPGTF